MQSLNSYDVWPLPMRVRSTDPGICSLTFFDQTYGVAGSLLAPTTRIGGTPLMVRGRYARGSSGQKSQYTPSHSSHGPKKGDALRIWPPAGSGDRTSVGAGGLSRHAVAANAPLAKLL